MKRLKLRLQRDRYNRWLMEDENEVSGKSVGRASSERPGLYCRFAAGEAIDGGANLFAAEFEWKADARACVDTGWKDALLF